jgi:hypothetical protein
MARPKQKKELKWNRKATIMYTEDEYAGIETNARKMKITVSSYIRAKSPRGYVRVPKYAKVDAKSVNELSRLGALYNFVQTHKIVKFALFQGLFHQKRARPQNLHANVCCHKYMMYCYNRVYLNFTYILNINAAL